MNKFTLAVSVTIFGALGGYIPVLFGADALGGWSLLFGTLGSFLGIWVWWRFIKPAIG